MLLAERNGGLLAKAYPEGSSCQETRRDATERISGWGLSRYRQLPDRGVARELLYPAGPPSWAPRPAASVSFPTSFGRSHCCKCRLMVSGFRRGGTSRQEQPKG